MDHRCLYGHRVPAAFTFAIQNRSCPTCGAPTVTLNGYQAARKLATEAGLDAVAAFHALRVIEADWVLSPATPPAVTAPTAGAAAAPAAESAPAAEAHPPLEAAPPPTEEEVVVVEDVDHAAAAAPPAPPAASPPEPRIVARVKPEKRAEPAVVPSAAPPSAGPAVSAPGFGADEEDFFKGA